MSLDSSPAPGNGSSQIPHNQPVCATMTRMTAPTETASTTTERARDYFKGLLIEAEIRRRLLRNYPGEPAVWADEIRAHLDSKVPDHDHEYYVKVGNGTL